MPRFSSEGDEASIVSEDWQTTYRYQRPTTCFGSWELSEALSLFDRDEALRIRRSRVISARADQTIVGVLLEHVRGPARNAADSEDWGVEIDRDAERVVGGR